MSLYQRACDGGLAAACFNQGAMYEKGVGLAQDVSKAAALYKKACDGGDMNGCNNLGTMVDHGAQVITPVHVTAITRLLIQSRSFRYILR